MTLSAPRNANAPAAHFFDMEPFQITAQAELQSCPLSAPGVCLNPMCSRVFAPTRSWQRYCCEACRKMDEAEMRRVGQKAAPALLAWRMGKYEASDEALRDLSRVGRNYITRLQSAWFRDRQARVAGRGQGGRFYVRFQRRLIWIPCRNTRLIPMPGWTVTALSNGSSAGG